MDINLIEKYCLKDNLATPDPYDIWKTKLGFWVKNGFNKNKIVFLLPAAILTIFDNFINNKTRFFYEKQEYPVVRAFAALSLINLYKKEPKQAYLDYAKIHIDWLVNNKNIYKNGFGWGIGFKLPISKKIIYTKDTAYSTNTPYILEALIEYSKFDNKVLYIDIIKSIFNFFEDAIQIMYEDEEIMATSYGPLKDRIVTNSISYTMYSYSLLLKYFPNKKAYIENKIKKLFKFIKKYQNNDGSWFYAPTGNTSFVDCFHSAFVIKNIIKTQNNLDFELPESKTIINNAYQYLLTNFYVEKYNLFKRFSISNKPGIVKFDLYDNAEMLNLAILMNDTELANKLQKSISENFVTNKGIYSVIDVFNKKRNKNTLRWAVMPYLFALSKI